MRKYWTNDQRSKDLFKKVLIGVLVAVVLLFVLRFFVQEHRAYLKTYREVTVQVLGKEHEYEPAVWGVDPEDGTPEIVEEEVNNFLVETDIAVFEVKNKDNFGYFQVGETYCVGVRGFENQPLDFVKTKSMGYCLSDLRKRVRNGRK